uniref:LOB domain-containing protein n=1 Tax=Oryza punctata TaxID=4537 RepID=A0A0E0KXZ1_ORYPU
MASSPLMSSSSLQELPEEQRADAVSSMVYEANARIRDPVYGCAGAICQLQKQKQVNDLKAQLARAHAELAGARAQHAHLVALLCMEMAAAGPPQPTTTTAAAAYCAAVGASPAAPVDALYVVDGAAAAAMQASPIGWVDEPLWT